MPGCMSDEECNGGKCELDVYDQVMRCTGCPSDTTGYQCECKSPCFVVYRIFCGSLKKKVD